MGRHKDPDTLNFIEWLRKKGSDLGYYTEIESPIGYDDYYVDVVWKYRKEQNPIFTFEVETTNHSRVFKNTMKIFGTSRSRVKKPFWHFMIILKNSLTEGQKGSLHIFFDHFGISLYENIFNERGEFKKLENKLNNLVPMLSREENPFLNLFKSYILRDIGYIEYAFSKFGHDLPFLLKDDFIPSPRARAKGEKHTYEKSSEMIEYLRNRFYKIKSIKGVNKEDLEIFWELTKLAERIDAKENCLLSQGICPKCGSKLTQKQIYHGGTEYDPEPYAVTYVDGCELCDYELNRETIDI